MDDNQPLPEMADLAGIVGAAAGIPGAPDGSQHRISDTGSEESGEEFDAALMGEALALFSNIPADKRNAIASRMWPQTLQLGLIWVLKSLPSHLRATLSIEALLDRFEQKWDGGELLEFVQQLNLAMTREREAAVSTFIPWCPVKPGMVLADELKALIPAVGSAPVRTETVQFKPTVPTPDTYSGPNSTDKLVALKGIAEWIESTEGIADLLSLPAEKRIPWAVRFLRGDAQSWWNGWPDAVACDTFAALREGLPRRFVGVVPFEILCADLRK